MGQVTQKIPEMNELGSRLSNAGRNFEIGSVVLELRLFKDGNKTKNCRFHRGFQRKLSQNCPGLLRTTLLHAINRLPKMNVKKKCAQLFYMLILTHGLHFWTSTCVYKFQYTEILFFYNFYFFTIFGWLFEANVNPRCLQFALFLLLNINVV